MLTGIYTVPISGANQDTFSYSILGGNNPNNDFSVNSAGTVFVNNAIPWSASGNNTYTLPIQVSNGAYTHTDTVSVNVTDNSVPSISFVPQYMPGPNNKGDYITGITVSAEDVHDLQSSFTLTNGSNNVQTYSIASTSWNGSSSLAYINVPDSANGDRVPESITVTATNTQGLSTAQTYNFTLGDPSVIPNSGTSDQVGQMVFAMASFSSSGSAPFSQAFTSGSTYNALDHLAATHGIHS